MRQTRALAVACALAAVASLALAGLGDAYAGKVVRVCHRRHHRRLCRTIKHQHTITTTSTTATTTTLTTTSSTTTGQATSTTTTTTSSAASLPHGTQVGERATGEQSPFYALDANERTFAAGTIHFNVYNYDQDPHTFAVEDASGQQLTNAVALPAGHPGTAVTLTVDLPPGTYTLFCTLPQHAALGMQTTIVVK